MADLFFMATGIGSVPFHDVDGTCRDIVRLFPSAPFWPQFVRKSHREDMIIQFSEGLPLLESQEKGRSVVISRTRDREADLVAFYESFFSQDLEHFSISREYAPGLYGLLDHLPPSGDLYIKGQSVGPVTFLTNIMNRDGKPALFDPELVEALVRGLAIKALWQIRALGSSGRRPILFFDEPGLSGYGSAFFPMDRVTVLQIFRILMEYIREHSDALIGIHCCGNTDWSMLLEANPDIINVDAFEYMEPFLLYREDIIRFLDRGGHIGWGIVPTSRMTEEESVAGLWTRLQEGLYRMETWGFQAEDLARRSLLTPACGMGSMTPELASKACRLLDSLSDACHRFWVR